MWIRNLNNGEHVELQFGADIVDERGFRHPYGIVNIWSASDLKEIGVVWQDDPVEEHIQETPVEQAPLKTRFPVFAVALGEDATEETVKNLRENVLHTDAAVENVGFFGNIWMRQLTLPKKGNYHQGHRHNFDHVTLVAQGKVLCEIDGCAPKVFIAPTWITIRKDDWHKFTALEDDTVYFCIYALRDVEGDVTNIYSGDNSPYGEAPLTPDEVRKRLDVLNQYGGCAHCDCDKTNGSE